MEKENTIFIRKNLLDLEYNKNLQYFTTLIVIIFTYFTALFIALVSRQINLSEVKQLIILTSFSILFLFASLYYLLKVYKNIQLIPVKIKELE